MFQWHFNRYCLQKIIHILLIIIRIIFWNWFVIIPLNKTTSFWNQYDSKINYINSKWFFEKTFSVRTKYHVIPLPYQGHSSRQGFDGRVKKKALSISLSSELFMLMWSLVYTYVWCFIYSQSFYFDTVIVWFESHLTEYSSVILKIFKIICEKTGNSLFQFIDTKQMEIFWQLRLI